MRIGKLAFLAFPAFLIVSLCAPVFSQTSPSDNKETEKKEKEKKEIDERVMQLLDRAILDGETLRLPQNRAVIYAIAGDLYWKLDEKRARALFRNAAAEILLHNQENDREKRESTDPYAEIFDYDTQTRNEILPLVAKHDAELALDMLLQTRPAKLTEALLRASQPNTKPTGDFMSFNPDRQKVNQELALEQQFALLAADENPEKAIKLIKDSLAKGISMNVMPLLNKLLKKDEKKAAELGGEVIKKLVGSDLVNSFEDMNVALNFLQLAFKPTPPANAKEKQFAFTDAQIRELAVKVANTLLQPSKTINAAMSLNRAMPMLEKFTPDRLALLKMRQAETENMLPPEVKRMQENQKIWDANSTPEDILAHLPKLQNEYEKVSAYESLVRKIGEIDDEARAKKIIDQIPDEKTRERVKEQFEAARIGRSATAGKLDEARKMIGNLSKKKTQVQRLVALAMDFQKKGGEKEIANAKSLMKDARALTNESAESNDDIADLMEVIKGYSTVEAEIAFRLFEPLIDFMNDYLQATAVLSKYDTRYASFKKGEMVLKINSTNWDTPIFRYISQMQLLGKADLEKMNIMADRFNRGEARAAVKLYVLQGFLKDDKKPDTTVPPIPGIYFY